jgi:hypothetical protein
MLMPGLHGGGLDVVLTHGNFFSSGRPGGDSASASVKADAVHAGVVDYCPVVNVVNVGDVHVVHCAVVVEGAVVPVSALIADTPIAEAVIDAAIETDMRPPVAGVPDIEAFTPTPIARGPEKTYFGSQHPRTRHPVIAILAVGPVTWRPNIALTWAYRLHVDRQHRRSNRDRHENAGERCGRQGQHHECKKQQTNRAADMHRPLLLPDHPSLARCCFAAKGCADEGRKFLPKTSRPDFEIFVLYTNSDLGNMLLREELHKDSP